MLRAQSLSLTESGYLDLNDNDMILDYTGSSQLAAVQALVAAGRNDGAWDGAGIRSTSAAGQTQGATMLGVIESGDFLGEETNGTFSGQSIDDTCVLVKYTWYGDADFNGDVDFDDYVRIDAGFNGSLTGWYNGDFDLSGGTPDFDDYVLIDLGYNTDGGTLRGDGRWAEIAQMLHSSEPYMYYLIDAMALRGVYLTHEDLFPEGNGRGDGGDDGRR